MAKLIQVCPIELGAYFAVRYSRTKKGIMVNQTEEDSRYIWPVIGIGVFEDGVIEPVVADPDDGFVAWNDLCDEGYVMKLRRQADVLNLLTEPFTSNIFD